jgi:predicted protein tyrosine phosphatase
MPPRPAPLVTFAEAETIGQQLHDRWAKMTGKAPLQRDDLGWADLIQFVLRTARDVVDQREAGGGS